MCAEMNDIYTFEIRWKEELVCHYDGQSLNFGYPMGTSDRAVYFPSASRWPLEAPAWAQGHRSEILIALTSWCAAHQVRLVVDPEASV